VADVDAAINTAVDGLRKAVLIRRIKWEVVGPPGGVFTDDQRDALAERADEADLSDHIRRAIDESVARINTAGLPALVGKHRTAVTEAWADHDGRRRLAPGEEVLGAVYKAFGGTFDKKKDGERIARVMRKEEIPEEIKNLIDTILSLPQRTSS
jgi:hypothetical protein